MSRRLTTLLGRATVAARTDVEVLTVANRSGRGLMMAGGIVILVGLCIVLVKVLRVPEYWVPLMVGVGLFLLGLIRYLTRKHG